jgi:hypothetical protein
VGEPGVLIELRNRFRGHQEQRPGGPISLTVKTLADAIERNDIVDRLRRVAPDSPRQWGKMTSHQMVCHLSDSFRMALGKRTPKQSDTRFRRTAIKWIALYAPTPWPKSVLRGPESAPGEPGAEPTDFSRDVSELERLLASFIDRIAAGELVRHPLFGPLTSWQWLRWGYLHTDHHLRQFGV